MICRMRGQESCRDALPGVGRSVPSLMGGVPTNIATPRRVRSEPKTVQRKFCMDSIRVLREAGKADAANQKSNVQVASPERRNRESRERLLVTAQCCGFASAGNQRAHDGIQQ